MSVHREIVEEIAVELRPSHTLVKGVMSDKSDSSARMTSLSRSFIHPEVIRAQHTSYRMKGVSRH